MSAPTAVPPSVQIATLLDHIERLECALENTEATAVQWEKRCRAAWSALASIEELAHQAKSAAWKGAA